MKRLIPLILLVFSAGLDADTPEQRRLQAEIDALRERLDQLEAQLQQPQATEAVERAEEPRNPATVRGEPVPLREDVALGDAVSGTERSADAPNVAPEPAIRIGGALRFNAVHREFADDSRGKRGESGLDVFRICRQPATATIRSIRTRLTAGPCESGHSPVPMTLPAVPTSPLPISHTIWIHPGNNSTR